MRPRKKVVVVDRNEERLGPNAMLLQVWGYRPVRWSGLDGLLSLRETDALVYWPPPAGIERRLLAGMKRDWPEVRLLVIVPKGGSTIEAMGCVADGYLVEGIYTATELREKLRILTARKRGPKKGFTKGSNSETSASVCAAVAVP